MLRVLLIASIAVATIAASQPASGRNVSGQDRSVVFFPLAADAAATIKASPSEFGHAPNLGVATGVNAAWANYIRLWFAHHQAPDDARIRSYLGLDAWHPATATLKPARAPVNQPTWPVDKYRSLETPHFQILSSADETFTRRVAIDAERFYWAWTQMFFPLWEGSTSVDRSIAILDKNETVADRAGKLPPLKSARSRMKIVVFADAAQYQAALVRDEPGVARSTGYYSDKLNTTFVYGGIAPENEADATATRYHELTHQLFREATFSTLRQRSPGETRDFWLVEGIAGYMESLTLLESLATVGGWDSERLQYSRYRMLVSADSLTLAELRLDGRVAFQRRSDLPRWYRHAIAQTHRFMDGDAPSSRQWLLSRLAELYRINSSVAKFEGSSDDELIASEQQHLRDFLVIDDDDLKRNSRIAPPRKLCLAGCEVTPAGLALIPPSPELSWLDLSRLKNLSIDDVKRCCPRPSSLTSLSLEATGIGGPEAAKFLTGATSLEELDLSSTRVDDSLAAAIATMTELQTLWLTGSLVGDEVIDTVAALKSLRTIDVQRSRVSDSALESLRRSRPELHINPLEVYSE